MNKGIVLNDGHFISSAEGKGTFEQQD